MKNSKVQQLELPIIMEQKRDYITQLRVLVIFLTGSLVWYIHEKIKSIPAHGMTDLTWENLGVLVMILLSLGMMFLIFYIYLRGVVNLVSPYSIYIDQTIVRYHRKFLFSTNEWNKPFYEYMGLYAVEKRNGNSASPDYILELRHKSSRPPKILRHDRDHGFDITLFRSPLGSSDDAELRRVAIMYAQSLQLPLHYMDSGIIWHPSKYEVEPETGTQNSNVDNLIQKIKKIKRVKTIENENELKIITENSNGIYSVLFIPLIILAKGYDLFTHGSYFLSALAFIGALFAGYIVLKRLIWSKPCVVITPTSISSGRMYQKEFSVYSTINFKDIKEILLAKEESNTLKVYSNKEVLTLFTGLSRQDLKIIKEFLTLKRNERTEK